MHANALTYYTCLHTNTTVQTTICDIHRKAWVDSEMMLHEPLLHTSHQDRRRR